MPYDFETPVYHYDSLTHEYKGTSPARVDPKAGTPLVPANATLIEPPEAGENQIAVFENNEWEVLPDYRGQIFYDETGQAIHINQIGATPEAEWATTKPVLPADIEAEVVKQRNIKILSGITVSGVSIKTDDVTQSRMIAVRIKAEADSQYSINWKTENGFVSLSAAQIIQISDAIHDHVQKCFDAEASVDISEIESLEDVGAAYNTAFDLL